MSKDFSVIGRALATPARSAILNALMDGSSRQARELARARLCYDHLAGRLGVTLMESMTAMGWLQDGDTLTVTDTGQRALAALDITVDAPAAARRPLCRACADWTERRPHLAGRLGATLASHAWPPDGSSARPWDEV